MLIPFDIEVTQAGIVIMYKVGDDFKLWSSYPVEYPCEKLNKPIVPNADNILVGFNTWGYDSHVYSVALSTPDIINWKQLSDNVIEGQYKAPKVKYMIDLAEAFGFRMIGIKRVPAISLKAYDAIRNGETVKFGSFEGDVDTTALLDYLKHDVQVTEQMTIEKKAFIAGKITLAKMSGGNVSYSNGTMSAMYIMDGDTEIARVNPNVDLLPETRAIKQPILTGETGILSTVPMGNIYLQYSAGGAHGTKMKEKVKKDGTVDYTSVPIEAHGELVQLDISSMYPNIILNHNLLGHKTNKLRALIALKQQAEDAGDMESRYVYKIIINSIYGNLGSKTSALSQVNNAMWVRLIGQDLVTRMVQVYGAQHVINVNTDGILAYKTVTGIAQVTSMLNNLGYAVEDTYFTDAWINNVNDYVLKYKDKDKFKVIKTFAPLFNDTSNNTQLPLAVLKMAFTKLTGHAIDIYPNDYRYILKTQATDTRTGRIVGLSGKDYGDVFSGYRAKIGEPIYIETVEGRNNVKYLKESVMTEDIAYLDESQYESLADELVKKYKE